MDDTAHTESRASDVVHAVDDVPALEGRTVRIGTALGEVMLMLVEGGRRYLREHPEALRAPFPFTPRSESR